MQKTALQYFDRAMTKLRDLGLIPEENEEAPIIALLNRLTELDEANVTAIARTLSQASLFNEIVREQVSSMTLGERYEKITESFNSIREDAKTMVEQVEDGKIDTFERISNIWVGQFANTDFDIVHNGDTNGDGTLDLTEAVDSDGDGLMDVFENGDLSANTGTVAADTDSDGRPVSAPATWWEPLPTSLAWSGGRLVRSASVITTRSWACPRSTSRTEWSLRFEKPWRAPSMSTRTNRSRRTPGFAGCRTSY